MKSNSSLALLVQLPIPPPGPQPIQGNVPLAAAYLKLFAQRRGLEGWQIEILPPRISNRYGDQAMVTAILDYRPRFVGFTCYLWNIQRSLWIALRLKAAQPDLRILLGGPEITPDNQWVLNDPAVDMAAIGEGEQTFVELLAALARGDSTEGIAGLWNRGGRLPVPRSTLTDLDLVSSPYIEGILDAAEERTMLMETTRGCRYRCKFCFYPKSYDAINRMSAGQIEADLNHACRQGVQEIYLLDPTLNQRPDFNEFLRLLARGNPDHQFTYSAELRAEGIRAETAALLHAANFQEVEVGLQSVDPQAQKLMGRHISMEAFERGARAMLDEGIRVRVDLILGLPGDTVDSVRRGLEYLDRVRPFSELQVFNLSILPGTAFRQTAGELGLDYQPRPPYYVLKTPTLDLEDLYGLMEEAQEVFGIVFDDLPPPEIDENSDPQQRPAIVSQTAPLLRSLVIDLDDPLALVPSADRRRSLAFTLWLKSVDFRAQVGAAVASIRQVLAENPHTTLQVVLEPTGDPRNLTAAVLESLLAACHESLSYLDWFYSLHPVRLQGAKRLVVLLPGTSKEAIETNWLDVIEDRATIVWCEDHAGSFGARRVGSFRS
jgi:hypothetical protein